MVFSSLVTSTMAAPRSQALQDLIVIGAGGGVSQYYACFKLDVDNSERSTLEVVKCLVSDLKNEDACIKEVCKLE